MDIGTRILKRRLEMQMTQQELADKLGYTTRSSITKIEKGNNDIPRTKIIEIANALQTTPSYLMGYNDVNTERISVMNIGQRIRFLRKENNMTLEFLANKVGTSKQTIQRYEMGVISNIPSDKIELVAKMLHTTPSYLMGWSDIYFANTELLNANGIEKVQEYINDLIKIEEYSK